MVADEMTPAQVRRTSAANKIYGLSVLLALGAGIALWVAVGKPKEFYTKNGLFHAKVGLFILMGAASVIPTKFFKKSRSSESNVALPKSVLMSIRFQLLLLLAIPLLATLMAQGIGLSAE